MSLSSPVPPRFLDFCRDHGGYTGCPFPDKVDPQHEQDLLKGLSKLSISTSGMAGPGQAGSWLVLVRVEVRKTARLLSLQGPKVTTTSPRIWRVKPTCPCKWSRSGETSTEEMQLAFAYQPGLNRPSPKPSPTAPPRDRKAGGGSLQPKPFPRSPAGKNDTSC